MMASATLNRPAIRSSAGTTELDAVVTGVPWGEGFDFHKGVDAVTGSLMPSAIELASPVERTVKKSAAHRRNDRAAGGARDRFGAPRGLPAEDRRAARRAHRGLRPDGLRLEGAGCNRAGQFGYRDHVFDWRHEDRLIVGWEIVSNWADGTNGCGARTALRPFS
jgi:hypothetical protein